MKKYPLFLSFLFCVNAAFSQWNAAPWANNPISVQPYDQQDVKITSDSKGGAILAWLDFRADFLQKKGDIYVQRIDRDGYIKWTLNGILVCGGDSDQTAPVIEEDGVGGALIAWVDKRNGTKDIYAQRIDSMGNVLWGTNGVGAAVKSGSQDNPRILDDGSQGALLIWEDDSLVNGDANLFMQHISNTGSVLWGASGYRVCNSPGAQINPKMTSNTAAGAIITWQDKRNGSDYDLYAQHVNASGIMQWTANGTPICLFAETQSNPKIVSDLAGGALISWQDKRSGIDYDIYAQYINWAGAVQWLTGGKVICNSLGVQSAIDMTGDASGGAIITWKDGRSATNFDIYAQKINLAGTVQWTSNGVGIVTSANDQVNPNVVPDGLGGAIVVWQDSSLGNWDVRSQRIDAAGSLLWTAGGVDVGNCYGNQTSPKNVSDGMGGSIYSFQDKRSGDFDVYAAKVDASGTLVSVQDLHGREDRVKVFPNPSSGPVTIKVNGAEFGSSFTVEIYNLQGELLSTGLVKGKGEFVIAQKMQAGTYMYRVSGKSQTYYGKFIIE